MSWTIKGNGTGEDLLYSQAGTPSLDLRFAATKSLNDYVSGNNLITFTRATTGTFVDSNGLIQTAASNAPRFDHNPTTGESLGLLVEEARTNLLLNSATLSTQSATVTAAANTLSFYGTGTVTLTGVSTAGPLVGTGANNRVSLTFTPTAGSLTLTVSGSVTNAQLELGASPTSYIPTTTATVTRAADLAIITGTNFLSWYPASSQGALFWETKEGGPLVSTNQGLIGLISGTTLGSLATGNGVKVGSGSPPTRVRCFIIDSGTQFDSFFVNPSLAQMRKGVIGYELNNSRLCVNSTLGTLDTSCTIPAVSTFIIKGLGTYTVSRIVFWSYRLPDSTLQAITAL